MGANYVKAEYNITDDYSSLSMYEEETLKPASWKVAVGLTLFIIILITIIGNTLVIITFASDWRLRANRGNWFILNLSISDLIIGLIVLPINSVWVVNESWPLEEIVCKIWIVVDYTACYVSVLSMVMISLDRYWLVTKKLAYRDFLTMTKVRIMLASPWLCCIVFYGVFTFFWTSITGDRIIDYSEDCEMESVYNLLFNTTLIIVEFIIPLVIILLLNYQIYRNIKIRSKQFVHSSTIPSSSTVRAKNVVVPMTAIKPEHVKNNAQLGNASSTTNQQPQAFYCLPSTAPSQVPERKQFAKHRRAAYTLGVLITVFIGCWLPYYVTVIIGTFCDECVPDSVWEFTNYLLWCNSTLNPFLYALLHTRFRAHFIRLFRLNRLDRLRLFQTEGHSSESTM